MNYDTFLDMVTQRARVDSDRAVALTRATLRTLADRLTSGEAYDLAAQLPQPLQMPLRPATEAAERFPADEFVRRTAERAGVDGSTARTGVRAVLTTLREALSGGEFDDVMTQLPRQYHDLVEPVLMPGGMARPEFRPPRPTPAVRGSTRRSTPVHRAPRRCAHRAAAEVDGWRRVSG